MITDKRYCLIGICEDDKQYREFLVNIIRKNIIREDQIQIYFFSDGASLFSFPNWKELDILFMDVELPDGNGHIFAEKFRRENAKAIVAFCTNIGHPQADLFRLNIYRYIRKEIGQKEVERQVTETLEEYRRQRRFKNFHIGQKEISVEIPDIVYCEKQKRGTKIYLRDNSNVLVTEHLNDIYGEIYPYGFSCPHGSYLVNMEHIIGVNKKKIILFNGDELAIAPRKWKQFQEDFKGFIS